MVLDLNVYHRMLRGAVTFGEDFEENYMKQIFELNKGMTQAISWYSRHADADKKAGIDGKYVYCGESPVSAESKIRGFYVRTMWYLGLAALALLIVTNLLPFEPKRSDAAPKPPAQTTDQKIDPIAVPSAVAPAITAPPTADSARPEVAGSIPI